ncbi:hypothetical protein SAMN04487886_10125 [Clostridium sp. DSM 8431]|nr:hypothetical protein SAMN04487886_10125 [Clostridium sp. DSM 8431]
MKKHKNLIIIVAALIICSIIILNTCPTIENWLHEAIGWY